MTRLKEYFSQGAGHECALTSLYFKILQVHCLNFNR